MFFGALGSLPLGTAPVERIPVPPSPGGSTSAGGGIFNTYFHPIPKVRRNDNEIAILLAAYQEYYSED